MESLPERHAQPESGVSTTRRSMLKAAWTIPAVVALGSIPAYGQVASPPPRAESCGDDVATLECGAD